MTIKRKAIKTDKVFASPGLKDFAIFFYWSISCPEFLHMASSISLQQSRTSNRLFLPSVSEHCRERLQSRTELCFNCFFCSETDTRALAKERQKKDNHNLSEYVFLFLQTKLMQSKVVFCCRTIAAWNWIIEINYPCLATWANFRHANLENFWKSLAFSWNEASWIVSLPSLLGQGLLDWDECILLHLSSVITHQLIDLKKQLAIKCTSCCQKQVHILIFQYRLVPPFSMIH